MDSAVATRADIDEVLGVFRGFMTQVDERFNKLEERFGELESKFSVFDGRVGGLESSFSRLDATVFVMQTDISEMKHDIHKLQQTQDHMSGTLDGILVRLDNIETDNAARDVQFGRLVNWSFKVAVKTDIPLKDF